MDGFLTPYCEFAGVNNAMDSRSTQANAMKASRPLPQDLQKRAARAGWRLSVTSSGYMLRKGIYSRHFGELIDVARDVAKLAVPRKNGGIKGKTGEQIGEQNALSKSGT